MNPSDPYYLGALPSVVQFCIGLGIVTVIGWVIAPRRKK